MIGTTGPILDSHYTHAELDALFMQCGFPGDPPDGNKTQKCLQWMRRANSESSDPLMLYGRLIAELMDGEPTPWRIEQYAKDGDARDRIQTSLGKEQLSYLRGGHMVGGNLKGPSKSLAELLKSDGMAAVDIEYQRAYSTIVSDPGAAVTAACAIVEAVCKHYLETESIPLPNKQTIAPLWTEVAKHLGLSPGQMADDDLKQILSGLFSITAGVGALRTHEGSAHGHENKKYRIEGRHARLAVHAAHTMSHFILETWEARGRKAGTTRRRAGH
ncbi:abortive infection family protein [Tardiphaga sp. vice304]|uniref:abortive infection family protein n=1 Tax=Tardiphaga sp. vice304 TaxID=2592817 RepID=UPI001AEEC18F|nr:abortive infection family protein [Tardiphaga sp. vice304]